MVIDENFNHIKARLVAKRPGDYTVYVFENLDQNNGSKYIMCTKAPNWNSDDIKPYQEGFLKYKSVNAGLDTWFDSKSMTHQPYRYTANYFMDFIPLAYVVDGNRVVQNQQLIVT